MSKRLTILAGDGALPNLLAQSASALGWEIQILSLLKGADFLDMEVKYIKASNPVDIIFNIRRFKTSHICMVGGTQISDKSRQNIFKLLGNKSKKTISGGDSALSKLGKALEISTGAKIIAVHEIMPQLLAGEGIIAGPKLKKSDIKYGIYALKTAYDAGRLDLGQAVICSGNRLIAVEDIAGTDALIKRVYEHKKSGLVGDGSSILILAKTKKPNQPSYVDLPAIGPNTILAVKNTGISAIFVEANNSIIIELEKIKAMAQEHSISVYGVSLNHAGAG